ncbi:purine permease 3-like [Diospyros lotus]|uniref:purine permease 3-like n=1 Tax=Diospyros lotus TaxID=55363 RepID=UPI0022539D73|nr:purine permease 3-like [Diospyros lotus]
MEIETPNASKKTKKGLLVLNAILLTIGNCVGPLVMRLYYIHGGERVWLSSWLETAAWPLIFIPLTITYWQRRRKEGPANAKFFFMKWPLFLAAAGLGVITGFDDYFYAYGFSRLPVSTAALIIAAQLGFTAVFAYFLVKQKFTAYSINAVVLLTIGAGVLAMHTNNDRPAGETSREYYTGFLMTVAAAVLYGLLLPLVEYTYVKTKQAVTYTLVIEIQMVMCLFATVVCTVGMFINNDFKAIPIEAKAFELGTTTYYVILVCSGIIWQCFYMGAIGVIFSDSSLLSAIIIAVLLPVTEVLAVIFYHEKFQAEKGLSLVLSLWGFTSYFYGELQHPNKVGKTRSPDPDMQRIVTIP